MPDKPRQIKLDIDEISLAFDPANMRKFLMHKDKAGEEKSNPKAEFSQKVAFVLLAQ